MEAYKKNQNQDISAQKANIAPGQGIAVVPNIGIAQQEGQNQIVPKIEINGDLRINDNILKGYVTPPKVVGQGLLNPPPINVGLQQMPHTIQNPAIVQSLLAIFNELANQPNGQAQNNNINIADQEGNGNVHNIVNNDLQNGQNNAPFFC